MGFCNIYFCTTYSSGVKKKKKMSVWLCYVLTLKSTGMLCVAFKFSGVSSFNSCCRYTHISVTGKSKIQGHTNQL